MSISLEGKTALVTGAGRGIGRSVALQLAGAGASVALVARSRDELDETAHRVHELGRAALVAPADLGKLDQLQRAVRRTNDELGAVDILVNNAAVVWPLGASIAVEPAEWAAAIAINLVAVAVLSFALLPAMLERGWGRIVNVSSGIAAQPGAMIGANAYATGKAALEAHTINLAAELAGSGVTVNAFRPGSVDTAMPAWIRGQDPMRIGAPLHQRFARSYAEGQLISPEQAARSLLMHLQRDATGEIWDVSDTN
jgi:NAD(P)-dependent dehydrogenase (short-subunit alcohol dehydrogenase family)